jgi:HEPN domain-containing protein
MAKPILGELEERLRESDEETRFERASRLADLLLLGQPEDGCMLFGGTECMNALREATGSYVDGAFLATILTAQICVEKLLSAAIELETSTSPSSSYADLLKEASTRGWLSEYERSLFDRMRKVRNPYVHHRSVQDEANLERRAVSTGESTEALLEDDARDVVRALIHLVSQPPFALGPIVVPFDGEDWLPPVHPEQISLLSDQN